MKKSFKTIGEILLFVFAFLAFQTVAQAVVMMVERLWHPFSLSLVVSSAVGSVLTIAVFAWLRWSPVDRTFLRSRPWTLLLWTVILTLGTIVPSMAFEDACGWDMPEAFKQVFHQLMSRPEGYLAIAILAPLAEEMVFRGAVLRSLLNHLGRERAWIAIVLSALLFGLVHFNLPQGIHAALLGLLLGWLYVRTGSIVPGLVFHWVNNSVAYALVRIMPQWEDAELIDIFGTQSRAMLAVVFSLLIFLPALYQIVLRTRHKAP